MFCYEIKLAFPNSVSDQKFENSMDLLLITDACKSYYVYIKDFNRFMFYKTKNENKNTFVKVAYSVLVVKMRYRASRRLFEH